MVLTTAATRKEARNRMRLPSEEAFLEALESSEDLPGRILAVHVAAEGGEVWIELSPAGEALDRLTALASALGGEFAALSRADQAALRRSGAWKTSQIEEYIESLPLVAGRSGAPRTGNGAEADWRGEHLALVVGPAEAYRRSLRALLRFNFDPGSGILEAAALQGSSGGYLIHFRGLGSVYPLLEWEEDPAVTVFYPIQEGAKLHVESGYSHPLRRVEDYHGGLGDFTLAPARGPWIRLANIRFAPLTASVAVEAGIHEVPLAMSAKDFGADERLEVKLELVPASPDQAPRGREGKLHQRIERLEKFRDRTNARLSELYGILEPSHESSGSGVLYCFPDSRAESLHGFVAGYPFSLVKGFRYVPVYWRVGEKEGGILHFLEPIERAALPPIIAVDCEVYRPDGNFDRLGVPIYIPAGERLWPAVHFSPDDVPALRAGILGEVNEQRGAADRRSSPAPAPAGSCEAHPENERVSAKIGGNGDKFCVLRRIKGSKELLKLVIDRRDFRPLNESVRFLNRTVRRGVVEALTRTAVEDSSDGQSEAGRKLRANLDEAEGAVRADIQQRIEAIRAEAEAILAQAETRRASLSTCQEKLQRSAELDRAIQDLDERSFGTLEGLLQALRDAALRRFQEPSARRQTLIEQIDKLKAELTTAISGSVGELERNTEGLEEQWAALERRLRTLGEQLMKLAARRAPDSGDRSALDRAVECLEAARGGSGDKT